MRISDWSSDVCSSDLIKGRQSLLPRHQHPSDNPTALVVENHGQQSIERARGRNIFQLKRINEIGRLQADDAKGQGARLFGAEIQNSGLQRKFSSGKGPFAVLETHLLSFEQLIVKDAARVLQSRKIVV